MKTPGLILGAALLALTAWAQTNSQPAATNLVAQPPTLVVVPEAETNVAPDSAAMLTNAAASTATTTNPPAEIRITSDVGEMGLDTRVAIHRGNVVATITDPILRLACDVLTIRVPKEGERPDNILAEGHVVIDHEDKEGKKTHATGNKALYEYRASEMSTNETITLSGNALVDFQKGVRVLKGDTIVWDLIKNAFYYTNPAVSLQLTSESSSTNSPSGSTRTNAPAQTPVSPDS